MATRPLTATLNLTELGLGAAQFGNLNRETTDEASDAAVEAAWKAGIRYFDTAPYYGAGLSERRLGRAPAQRPREEFVLSTKVGRLLQPSTQTAHLRNPDFVVPADPIPVWDFSRDGVLRSIEHSLGRLGLDRIDIAYLHDPDDHWDQASTTGIAALKELREQGVLGAIGVGMNQSAMPTAFVREHGIDVVMLAGRLTLLDQSSLADLLPAVRETGTRIVAAGVYNSGILANAQVPESAHYNYAEAPVELLERARQIAVITARHGLTLPEAAIQFCLAFDDVASVVIGTRTADHVTSAVQRYQATAPAQLWEELVAEGLLAALPNEF